MSGKKKKQLGINHYLLDPSYQKAMKKIAVQISKNIKPDITYRNIPFGSSQLDIHSDGETAIIAVKVLTGREDAWNVREFHLPASKIHKFLISDKVQSMLSTDGRIFLDSSYLVKQISQGISQLLHNSKNNNNGKTWTFPFYNHFIVFKQIDSTFNQAENAVSIVGNTSAIRVDLKRINMDTIHYHAQLLREMTDHHAEGYENHKNRHNCLDFSIHNALTWGNSQKFVLLREYDLIDDSIPILPS